jgi:hypothetical protein
MAVTSRDKRQPASGAAELAERIEQLEQMQTITLRILARLAVSLAPGQYSASFGTIITDELRAATREEVAAVEAWLTAHPAGG